MWIGWFCLKEGSSFDIGCGCPVGRRGSHLVRSWHPHHDGSTHVAGSVERRTPTKQQCGHSGCLAGRKCLIAFILVFFREDGRLSLLGCAVVLIGSVLVEKRTHPFEVDSIS